MNRFFKKTAKHTAIILLIVLLAPSVFMTQPFVKHKKAEAILGIGDTVVEVGGNLLANWQGFVKDWVVIPTLRAMAKALLRQITQATINWIRNGFEGKPIFISNPDEFIKQSADLAVGIYLEDKFDNPQIFCSPFRTELLLGISAIKAKKKPACTLSGIIDNVNRMFNSFERGGWAGYLSISTVNNNAIGQVILQYDRIADVAARTARKEDKRITLNKGFNVEGCQEWTDLSEFDNPEVRGEKTGKVVCTKKGQVTPGAAVEGQLITSLGSDIRWLEVSDSIDAIISVAIEELAFWAMGPDGLGGLLGGQEEKGRNITLPNPAESPRHFATLLGNLDSLLNEIIPAEKQYLNAKRQSEEEIDKTVDILEELSLCEETDLSGKISSKSNQLSAIRDEIITIERFIKDLEDGRARAVETGDLAALNSTTRRASGKPPRPLVDINEAQQDAQEFKNERQEEENKLQECRKTNSYVIIRAEPEKISLAESSTLKWDGYNVEECTASGGWSGLKQISGTENKSPIQTTAYEISCQSTTDTSTKSSKTTITVE